VRSRWLAKDGVLFKLNKLKGFLMSSDLVLTSTNAKGFNRTRIFELAKVISALLILVTIGWAASVRADPSGLAVVELFTSQGCSSCPPADALLVELTRRPNVLPLGFHVDYWDRLGWRDPFSSHAATARQESYARILGLSAVYTPQVVINGRREAVGSDSRTINSVVANSARMPVQVTLAVENGTLSVTVGAGRGEGRLWLVTFDRQHETSVKRGENAGRTIVNVNVVRALVPAGAWGGSPLTLSLPQPPTGSDAAILLQAPDGQILGAASTSMPG
jgi:hypothetical protein